MNLQDSPPLHSRSALGAAAANVPYLFMLGLGMAVIGRGADASLGAWLGAAGFGVYGVLGALWIILFLCPHCPSFGKWSCPCGYGVIAARLRQAGDTSRFRREFRRHIAVIVPLWIIPPVVGGWGLVRSFSWTEAVLLGLFVLDAFVVLPLVSRVHGCKDCEQREECPWMK
jgi:hypothetical protein